MGNKISCPECQKSFRTESGLSWHLQKIHGKTSQQSNEAKAVQLANVQDTIQALEARLDSYGEAISELADKFRLVDEVQKEAIEALTRAGKLESRLDEHLASHRRLAVEPLNICSASKLSRHY
jgi:DNA repair exonuclease SbcCD ATPase subunit